MSHCCIVKTPGRARTAAELEACVEQIARDAVTSMITAGFRVRDMQARRTELLAMLNRCMLRDIGTFATTGLYPECAALKETA